MTTHHASLGTPPADHIGGAIRPLEASGAGMIESRNPAAPDSVIWRGTPVLAHVDEAVHAARRALPAWSGTPFEKRGAVLRRFAQICDERVQAIADVICDETGKVMWESRAEAALLAQKVAITLDNGPEAPLRRVSEFSLSLGGTRSGRCWFKPHGVMAVVGPFNFPAHLPNGHIVPALAMGNTIVFKPSDKAPAVGQLLVELFQKALHDEGWSGPAGVINLVQGGVPTASELVAHEGIDGVLFTGSWPVGRRIMEANLDRPARLLALEMGGNNAAIVMPDADLRQAAIEIARCAFNTTGQRCTCTRRVVVHRDVEARLTHLVREIAASLAIGPPKSSPVFMGPIISEGARQAVLDFQAQIFRSGARSILESRPLQIGTSGGWYLSPGIVSVPRFVAADAGGPAQTPGCDIEVFGPLLRITTVESLDDAIEQANATRYGLAASIFTSNAESARRFSAGCRAGCVNVNTGTAGASSKLPFGGLGLSGNHRPAGSFALDYCAYPVAGMTEAGAAALIAEGMRFDDAWLST